MPTYADNSFNFERLKKRLKKWGDERAPNDYTIEDLNNGITISCRNAQLKITDMRGQLCFELQCNGVAFSTLYANSNDEEGILWRLFASLDNFFHQAYGENKVRFND